MTEWRLELGPGGSAGDGGGPRPRSQASSASGRRLHSPCQSLGVNSGKINPRKRNIQVTVIVREYFVVVVTWYISILHAQNISSL